MQLYNYEKIRRENEIKKYIYLIINIILILGIFPFTYYLIKFMWG